MFCPNCGANIPNEFEVCPECGTEISVPHSQEGGKKDPFIVAEDEGEVVQTPFGPVVPVPEGEETTPRPEIIEAEEEELPENEGDVLPESSHSGTEGRFFPGKESLAEEGKEGTHKEGGRSLYSSEYESETDAEREFPLSPDISSSPSGDSPVVRPTPPRTAPEEPDDAEDSHRFPDSNPYPNLPSPSRKRPLIGGIAVIILVVLGIAILVYGLPGQETVDAGVAIPTLLPTPPPTDTLVPATETPTPFVPSKNLVLSVSAYDGGYKVEMDNGLKANEVSSILLTIEDTGGIHTMEWAYPSRRESFYMAREAYNGTPSANEYITATATFTDGTKEVVFSGDL